MKLLLADVSELMLKSIPTWNICHGRSSPLPISSRNFSLLLLWGSSTYWSNCSIKDQPSSQLHPVPSSTHPWLCSAKKCLTPIVVCCFSLASNNNYFPTTITKSLTVTLNRWSCLLQLNKLLSRRTVRSSERKMEFSILHHMSSPGKIRQE